jgi:hypothetical protein
MPTTASAAVLAPLVIFTGGLVSLLQDKPAPAPPPPPPATEERAPEAPKSDPEALAILEAAAKRQGGASLAVPGALRSFRIEFGNIKIWRHTRNSEGQWTSMNEAASVMAIDWMRHEGKPSSLRTFWEINGKKVWRAVYGERGTNGIFWLSDGKEVTPLNEGTHDADREEVVLHRRLSETLLDVAVLHKMRADGSIWTRVDDPAYDGVALRRTPAPGTAGLTFTIWLDEQTRDPHHVRVEPIESDAPTMHYALRYQDDLPASVFSVKGAELRFPREVGVHESYEGIPKRQVMNMFVDHVIFNEVKVTDFAGKSTLGQ